MTNTTEVLSKYTHVHENKNNRTRRYLKNIDKKLIIILVLFQMTLSAQKIQNKNNYDYLVREETGDLNNDGKTDKITVKMDTIDETRPFRFQIFLSQPNGKLNLAISSDKIIEPQYPLKHNGKPIEYQIPSFFIEKGVLSMWSEIKSGNITYDFKYQNGNFELVNVKKLTNNATKGYTDENTVFTEMNFDLLLGIKTETDEIFGASKPLSRRKKKILIRPLPKLQDFRFSDKNKY